MTATSDPPIDFTSRPPADAPYRDPSLAVEERLADLLARMTLEEKAAQTACPFAGWGNTPDMAEGDLAPGGVAWPVASLGEPPAVGAAAVNALQRGMVERTRLGIPTLVDEEALGGLKVRGATLFPDALAQAATWDPELIEEMAQSIGEDMVAVGVRQALSPLCDVARDPRWGRITESYGEDPYLVGSIATGFVRGLQRPGTIATLKHFVGYSASEGGRNLHPVQMGVRHLHEVHGLSFEMAIRLAGAGGVMASYNQIDGVPVQGSHELLTGLLRDEYGFDGVVISDLNSAQQLSSVDGVAADHREAAARSVWAGLDLELSDKPFTAALVDAVRDGLLNEADVERAAANVIRTKLRLGLFEQPYVDETAVPEVLDTPERRALSRRVADKTLTLLQNPPREGRPVLPVADADVRSIAVIGPNADRAFAMLGNYSYPVLDTAVARIGTVMDATRDKDTEQQPRPRMTSDDVVPLVESVPVATVLEGLQSRASDSCTVTYEKGCPIEVADTSGIDAAVALASSSDVAVVVVGDQSGIFEGATVGESVDSTSCALPGVQRQLVEAIAATDTPTVVVLLHGRPFVLDWLAALDVAVLSAWFPGEEGGSAVAAAVFGDLSPGGRAPASFPSHPGALPAPYNHTRTTGSSYWDGDHEPVFPFGHGLSYTTFEYSDIRLNESTIAMDGLVEVTCTVRNTGDRTADEVVQLYTRDPVARTSRPRRELKGFRRITVESGAAVDVTFELSADRVCLYDPPLGWVVEPGIIELMVGASSEDIRLRADVTVGGEARVVGADRALTTPVRVTPPLL